MRLFLVIAMLAWLPTVHAEPIPKLDPLQMEDGTRTWRLTHTSVGKPTDGWMLNEIRRQLGLAQWCSKGWEITEQKSSIGSHVVSGRCK